MEYTYLGRTGLKISRLCLGTMNFGPRTEEKDAFRILDMALDAGINYIDTANIYGSLHGTHENNHTGWTEEILGRWFAQGGQRRERVILATKVYCNMKDPAEGPNGDGNSAYKISRLPELEVLPAAKELGIAFLPWSPLHGGYLSGTMMNRHAGSRGAEEFAAHLSEAQKQQLLQYESLCTDIGESQADVALAWLLRNPGVTAPIIGPRTDRQLESALHAAEIKLSDDVLKELDRIFPGPGGEAPEAYAW